MSLLLPIKEAAVEVDVPVDVVEVAIVVRMVVVVFGYCGVYSSSNPMSLTEPSVLKQIEITLDDEKTFGGKAEPQYSPSSGDAVLLPS